MHFGEVKTPGQRTRTALAHHWFQGPTSNGPQGFQVRGTESAKLFFGARNTGGGGRIVQSLHEMRLKSSLVGGTTTNPGDIDRESD